MIDIIHRNDLQPTEINLVTKFLEQLLLVQLRDTSWVTIIDKLVNSSTDVLRNSQEKYGAIERILNCVTDLVGKTEFSEIHGENIIILSILPTEDLKLISWNQLDSGYEVKVHYRTEVATQINRNVPKVIISLPEIQSNGRNITILTFNEADFFNCDSYYKKFSPPVIQIFNSNSKETEKFLTVEYQHQTEISQTCFVSRFGQVNDSFFWRTVNKTTENNKSRIVCEFPMEKYFGLIGNVNVTYELEVILSDQACLLESLQKTKDLLDEFHALFQPRDVMYVTEVLEYVKGEINDQILDKLFGIVNGIMNIQLHVLTVAERIYRTSTKVLGTLAKSLRLFKDNKKYSLTNLYVSHLKYGFILKVHSCSEKTCEVTYLEGSMEKCDVSELCISGSDDQQSQKPMSVIILFKNFFKFFEDKTKFSTKVAGIFPTDESEDATSNLTIYFSLDTQQVATDLKCATIDHTQDFMTWHESEVSRHNNTLYCNMGSG